GNRTRIVFADGTFEQFGYDASGNVTSITNRRVQQTTFTYDANGLVDTKTLPDNSTIDYTFDSNGNLTAVTDARGTLNITLTANNRVAKVTDAAGHFLDFQYDAAGRRTRMTDELSRTLDYTYDSLGRLLAVADAGGDVVRYAYDNVGHVAEKQLGNGFVTRFTYDANDRVTRVENRRPDATVFSAFDYSYDTLGRVMAMTGPTGTTTYEYDLLGQLTAWQEAGGRRVEYSYDAVGNRVAVNDNSVEQRYSVNGLNQVVGAGGVTYSYDADGNLVQRNDGTEVTAYTYDADNRLTSVTRGGDVFNYSYDGLGRLVAATRNGVVSEYVLDFYGFGNVVGEYDGSGQRVTSYDHGVGLTARNDNSGNASYYLFDDQSNTSAIVSETGATQNSYESDPFGQTLSASETIDNGFVFVGEHGALGDDSGLTYLRARFYSPELGRFVSQDPIGLLGGQLNLYSYANNDPVNQSDPSGKGLFDFLNAIGSRSRALDDVIENDSLDALDSYQAANQDVADTAPAAAVELGDAFLQDLALAPLGKIPGGVGDLIGLGLDLNSIENAGQTIVELSKAANNRFDGGGAGPGGSGGGAANGGGGGTAGGTGSGGLGSGGSGGFGGGSIAPGGGGANTTQIDFIPEPDFEDSEASDSSVAGSVDPNEKIGPRGFGSGGFVAAGDLFSYRVNFENDAIATAPAQVVQITDRLDARLDWSTFELTNIGFGDLQIEIPAGSRSYSDLVRYTVDGNTMDVQIDAGIDLRTGVVTVVFASLDPDTGLPPDVLTGFLPPENETGRGQGFFGFTIDHVAGLSSGTAIRNIASIQFDFGEIIATNQVAPHDPSQGTDAKKEALVTIDVGPPTSSVNPLPATVGTSFVVSWNGSDDVGGAGVGTFDVFVSDDGGAFTIWLNDTPDTSATFDGVVAHTYEFYTVATDNVGHIEVKAAAAEASTMVVDGAAWQNGSEAKDVNNDTSVSAVDVLIIINEINTPSHTLSGTQVLRERTAQDEFFYDVNGDGSVTPIDALIVINEINSAGSGEEGESQSVTLARGYVFELDVPRQSAVSNQRTALRDQRLTIDSQRSAVNDPIWAVSAQRPAAGGDTNYLRPRPLTVSAVEELLDDISLDVAAAWSW
ncbi:MAG: RHS repeat-associated core domain-containing protein, partial [Planctomycetota bacterium]